MQFLTLFVASIFSLTVSAGPWGGPGGWPTPSLEHSWGMPTPTTEHWGMPTPTTEHWGWPTHTGDPKPTWSKEPCTTSTYNTRSVGGPSWTRSTHAPEPSWGWPPNFPIPDPFKGLEELGEQAEEWLEGEQDMGGRNQAREEPQEGRAVKRARVLSA